MVVVVTVACVLLAGCRESDDPGVGDKPITPAVIAAVAQEHVDLEPSRISKWGVFTRELGEESPGAQLEYADVSVAVSPRRPATARWSAPFPPSSTSA